MAQGNDKINTGLLPVELQYLNDGLTESTLILSYTADRKIKEMEITNGYGEKRAIISISYDHSGRPIALADNYIDPKIYDISYVGDSVIFSLRRDGSQDDSVRDVIYILDSRGRAVKAVYPFKELCFNFDYYDNNNVKSIKNIQPDWQSESSFVYDSGKRAIAENIDIPQWLVLHFYTGIEENLFDFLFHSRNNITEIRLHDSWSPILIRYSFGNDTGYPEKWAEQRDDEASNYIDRMLIKYSLME
ncbi:hypothetical protein [Dysgonomonas sp. 511]|uniref:hypothetical protein n=1 Tax=Dysgonomonas sp. 511 TaxID=2302930 RepID=UPI0013D407EE|nr:hypothetical protein [Dysgonomonas sp. 511]